MRRTGLMALLAALALALSHGGSARAQQTCVGANCSAPNPEPSPATGTGDWVRATSPTFAGTAYFVQIQGTSATDSFGFSIGGYQAYTSLRFYAQADITNGAKNNTVRVHQLLPGSAGNATAGLGNGLLFSARTSSANFYNDQIRISGVWTDATHATRSAAITFDTVDQAVALTERARIHADGGFQLITNTRPTCNAARRGTSWYVAGGAGVADTYEVCGKDAADSYAWVAAATF